MYKNNTSWRWQRELKYVLSYFIQDWICSCQVSKPFGYKVKKFIVVMFERHMRAIHKYEFSCIFCFNALCAKIYFQRDWEVHTDLFCVSLCSLSLGPGYFLLQHSNSSTIPFSIVPIFWSSNGMSEIHAAAWIGFAMGQGETEPGDTKSSYCWASLV